MDSIDRPEIFLLSIAFQSFLDKTYSSLFDNLNKSVGLKRAKTAIGAIRYLEANNPRAIIVTDEGLTMEENKPVLDKLVSYVRSGGLVIVGLHFPNFTRVDDFDKFFGEAFSLPWRSGDYTKKDLQLNPSCSLPAGVTSNSLPTPYYMKALYIRNARPHEKILVPVPDPETQSHVFPPGYIDKAQATVVGAKVGNGYLAYVGDVNPGEEFDKIILSLCGF